MPKLTTYLFSFCFILLCAVSQAQDTSNYSLLWKIEGPNLKEPSYLFGTMHVEDQRAFNFSDAVLPAIEHCEAFALEFHADSITKLIKSYTNKTLAYVKIAAAVNKRTYNKVAKRYYEVNEDSITNSTTTDVYHLLEDLYKKDKVDSENPVFVDLHLLSQARTMKKEINGLERFSDRNNFDSLSLKHKKKTISAYLKYNSEDYNKYLDSLKNIYFTGDIHKIDQFLSNNNGYDDTLTERNIEMVNSIIAITKRKTLFAAVGAAHLPGKTGIINLLQAKGYKVTKVNAQFTGVSKTYKVDKNLANWTTYKSDSLAYSIRLPENYVSENQKEEFEYNFSVNMNNGFAYIFFALDMRDRYNPNAKETYYTNYINNLKSKYTIISDSISTFKHKSLTGYQLNVNSLDKDDKEKTIITRVLINNGIVYSYSATGDDSILNDENTKTYFDSFKILKTYPLTQKNNFTHWKRFKNDIGGFSIFLPGNYENVSKRKTIKDEDQELEYDLKLYVSADETKSNNFLVRYNDLPLGYYLEDLEQSFKTMEETLLLSAKLLSPVKDITIEGLKAKEYELLIQEKYHAIVKVVFRGNRMYLLMQQHTIEGGKADPNHYFFNSFKLTALEKPTLVKVKKNTFEFEIYNRYDYNIIATDANSIFENSVQYKGLDTLSGNSHYFTYSKLKPYFRIKDLKAYYEKEIEDYLVEGDSVLSQKHVTFNGINALEFNIKSKLQSIEKYRIWLDQDYYFSTIYYNQKPNTNNKALEQFFNSYQPKKRYKTDYYSNKANQIFKALKARDSITKYQGLEAFTYYTFNKDELNVLNDITRYQYKDSIFQNLIIDKVNSEFSTLNDSQTTAILKEVYFNKRTSGENKQNTLYRIADIKADNYLEIYTDLLTNHTPKSKKTYAYSLMKPYRDSVVIAKHYFKDLLKLNKHVAYRIELLELPEVLQKKEAHLDDIISTYKTDLLHYRDSDLNTYKAATKTEAEKENNDLMSAYLSFYNSATALKLKQEVDVFTTTILKTATVSWLKRKAIVTRLKHNLNINQDKLKQVLDELDNPLFLIRSFETHKRLNEIPEAYLNEKFNELSVRQFLINNDEFTDDIHFEAKFDFEGKTYQPVKLGYTYNDETSYYLIVLQIRDSIFNTENHITSYIGDTKWDYFKEDFKDKSIQVIKESERFEK